MDKLKIYINNTPVGALAKESDKFIFTYTEDAPLPVSVTMPLRTESWVSKKLHPIFQMSLPEGSLKSTIEEKFSKIMKMDDLALLKLIGPYVIGRVKYGVQEANDDEISFEDILHNDTSALFEKLIEKFAIRSGVSGVQPKVLLDVYDKNTLMTQHYIVKSWGKEYPELAFNEYFCMKAITYAGLPTPDFFLSKNREMFIMKRFDIKEDNSFLGFEDGCVLLGKGTKDKYEASYEELAKAIKSAVKVEEHLPSLKKLFTAMIMNHFLGNGDGHLKTMVFYMKMTMMMQSWPQYMMLSVPLFIYQKTSRP